MTLTDVEDLSFNEELQKFASIWRIYLKNLQRKLISIRGQKVDFFTFHQLLKQFKAMGKVLNVFN